MSAKTDFIREQIAVFECAYDPDRGYDEKRPKGGGHKIQYKESIKEWSRQLVLAELEEWEKLEIAEWQDRSWFLCDRSNGGDPDRDVPILLREVGQKIGIVALFHKGQYFDFDEWNQRSYRREITCDGQSTHEFSNETNIDRQ